jgi:putative membrane protein
MIEYDPNRHWFRDLKHLGTSWTLRRIVRGVLAVGLYTAAIVVVFMWFDIVAPRALSGIFSLLGLILSIIMVFRTNSAYDRWWEGRKQWGALTNHARGLAIQLDAVLRPEAREERELLARLIGNFALALSGHLRDKVDRSTLAGVADDVADDGQPGFDPPDHVPAFLARLLVARIHRLRREGAIDGFDLVATKPHTQAMLEAAGACDRIRRTPIPFSYSVFIKLFIVAYSVLLPLGMVPEYGFFAVPLVMLIVFALLGLELMAEEIEEPFGLDCNDLPTETIARRVQLDTATLLRVAVPHRVEPAEPYSKVF